MKVYLDNNIIVGIENGDYESSAFKSKHDAEYFYSAAHIDELIEGEQVPQLSIDKRLSIIDNLAGENHILNGYEDPEFLQKSARELYDFSHSFPQIMMRDWINSLSANFNPDRDKFLDILKLKKIEVNNIKPCNIISEIDRRLQEADDPRERISVREYLDRSEAVGRSVYCALFNLLDFACFHKDKQTDHSNIARMHDASHAYFAQLCDIFVSDDKKMRYKTEALYAYLGVKTKVMNGIDFLNFTERDINNGNI